MRVRTLLCAALTAAVAACAKADRKPPQAVRPNWLHEVPYIAQSILEDTTGTPEAQHAVLLSPAPIDSVAAFYRTRLPLQGWRIMSDVSDTIHVSLYLERGGLPLWIQIDAQGPQSRISFMAAGGAGRPAPAPAPH